MMVTILLVAMFKTAEILKIYTLNKHLRILGKVEAIVCTFMYSFLKNIIHISIYFIQLSAPFTLPYNPI